jgi:tetratricopeptide (TPR) repeat protein
VRLHPVERALTLVALLALTAATGEPPGKPRSNEALALCDRGGKAASADEKRQLLARGLAAAEEAVAADERDPKAHFAIFCNLGKRLQLSGVGLNTLSDVRRLGREVDRTIELAPGWSDALVGKGSFLIDLPGFLGGDRAEGERLLREALRIEPDFVTARVRLARALADRGARDEARTEAEQALAAAEKKGDREGANDAREVLAKLRR